MLTLSHSSFRCRAALAVSQAYAQLMGGTLSVESELGKGSTFTLRVPVRLLDADEVAAVAAANEASEAPQQAAQSPQEQHATADTAANKLEEAAQRRRAKGAEEAAQPPQPRVLVADDHPLNLRLISRLLQLQGFEITAVADGGAALEALEALTEAGTVPFDLAVLDMNMPIMSGPEAAAAYRQWEAAARPDAMRLPIIALTANALEEHAAECIDNGCVARQRARSPH
jgi:CheY-like chemotaxis protein